MKLKKTSFTEYFGITYIILAGGGNKIQKHVKKHFNHDLIIDSNGCCTVLYDKRTIIISITEKHMYDIPLFVHEAYHAVNFSCDIIRAEMQGTEFETYLIQYLCIKYLTDILNVNHRNFTEIFEK
jgi:hypothetical protein